MNPQTTSVPANTPSSGDATNSRTAKNSIFYIVALSLIFVFIFQQAIWGTNDFIVRDVGRYYMNFYRIVQEEWSAGRIPLWTPYDNCGTPLMANACTAVFYPPKLLFLLPASFEDNLKYFILFHFILTIFSTWKLARYFDLPPLACFITTCSFVFSSPVLFGFCNLPFLCSTAWLPLAIRAGLKLLAAPSLYTTFPLAIYLSLMVFCGDPQAVYHTGLMLAIAALIKVKFQPSSQITTTNKTEIQNKPTTLLISLGWLLIAAGIAGGLSAIQILPMNEYNSKSLRSAAISPTSIWDVPAFLISRQQYHPHVNWYDTFIGNPAKPASHYLQIYSFSYSPLRFLEWISPGIYGSQSQPSRRWSCLWGFEEPNVWFPSVCSGIIIYLLAINSITNISKFNHNLKPLLRWLMVLVVISFLASFGRYGIYGSWYNFCYWAGFIPADQELQVGGEIGGLYWLFNIFLPAYSGFRFPAKWLIFTMLGISCLAGFGTTLLMKQEVKFTFLRRYCLVGIGIIILSLFCLSNIPGQLFQIYLTFKEYQLNTEMWNEVVYHSLKNVLIYLLGYFFLSNFLLESPNLTAHKRSFYITIFILIGSLEVIATNYNQVMLSKREDWKSEIYASTVIKKAETIQQNSDVQSSSNQNVTRIFQPNYFIPVSVNTQEFNEQVKNLNSKARDAFSEAKMLLCERDVLAGDTHQQEHLSNVFIFITIDHEAYMSQFDLIPQPDGSEFFHPRRAYDLWGTKYFLICNDSLNDSAKNYLGMKNSWKTKSADGFLPQGEPLPDIIQQFPEIPKKYTNLAILKNTAAFPHARIVHQYQTIKELNKHDLQSRTRLYLKMFVGVDGGLDHHKSAIIETSDNSQLKPDQLINHLPQNPDLHQEFVKIVQNDPQHILMNAYLQHPGLIILSELNYPGWYCRLKKSDQPFPDQLTSSDSKLVNIEKVNHLMRGIIINKPGHYQLEFVYKPNSFYLGTVISLITILGISIVSSRKMWDSFSRKKVISSS